MPIWYIYYTFKEHLSDPEFEYDGVKSLANLMKHGIEFAEAQALWLDERLIEIPARTEGEARSLVIGRIGQKVWSAVITRRGERIRIISVRRARPEEVAIHES